MRNRFKLSRWRMRESAKAQKRVKKKALTALGEEGVRAKGEEGGSRPDPDIKASAKFKEHG
jgi:hypothetical protein